MTQKQNWPAVYFFYHVFLLKTMLTKCLRHKEVCTNAWLVYVAKSSSASSEPAAYFFFSFFFFSCTNMFVCGSAALWGPKHTFSAQGEGVAMTSAHFEVFRFPDKFIPSFFCDRFNFTRRVWAEVGRLSMFYWACREYFVHFLSCHAQVSIFFINYKPVKASLKCSITV